MYSLFCRSCTFLFLINSDRVLISFVGGSGFDPPRWFDEDPPFQEEWDETREPILMFSTASSSKLPLLFFFKLEFYGFAVICYIIIL